jgi:hypothetical protein
MNAQQLLEGMVERISARASVKNVYGDPVVLGNPTVIPVAQVAIWIRWWLWSSEW